MSGSAPIQINPDEIKEVVGYIGKMKDYDRSNFNKLQQVNELIWGLFLFYAGCMDYLFNKINHPELVVWSWGIASGFGTLLSLFINTRKSREIITQEMEDVSKKMASIYRKNVIFTIVVWLVMFVFIYISKLYFLVMPIVSFFVGSSVLGYNLHNVKIKTFYRPSNRIAFITFLCYLSTAINLIGYFINPDFIHLMGIITGIILGIAFGSGALVDRY